MIIRSHRMLIKGQAFPKDTFGHSHTACDFLQGTLEDHTLPENQNAHNLNLKLTQEI